MNRILLPLFVWLSLATGPALADDLGKPTQTKTVRLLTVGNSFSQNATRYLADLAKADGNVLVHHSCAIGGGTLAQHVEKIELLARNPQDPKGRYSTGKTLHEELVAEPWDFVTIQQASIHSHNFDTYQPAASKLRDFIKQHAPNAELVVHQTWAYRVDDPRFRVSKPRPGEPATQKEMYQGLTAAYRKLANDFGVGIIPVGDAFYLADTDERWGYRPDATFDPKTAAPGKLPDQSHSLHVGWRWTKNDAGEPKLSMDGHHASVAGQYLAACVFYEALFDRRGVGNKFVPPGLDPEYARFLQEVAQRAVEQLGSPALLESN